ncbi:MAG TPA: hypothetical protein VHW01_09770 [Polyangiaceae bacterium]|jgi:hypothetical protein|nr:hypothetical protein [Polyangiaceae bacterium]
MSDRNDLRQAARKVLDVDEVEGVLTSSFYAPSSEERPKVLYAADPIALQEKPTHYKVICISMYTEDLKRLDTMVDTLKARGLTKANRSALIRYALGAIDLDNVPKGL